MAFKANQLNKNDRIRLAELLKSFKLSPLKLEGFNQAVVTSGGVCLKEINPKTMESKIVKGLFFAGEGIDVDAYTGGFNLQIAWATAYAAGHGVKTAIDK